MENAKEIILEAIDLPIAVNAQANRAALKYAAENKDTLKEIVWNYNEAEYAFVFQDKTVNLYFNAIQNGNEVIYLVLYYLQNKQDNLLESLAHLIVKYATDNFYGENDHQIPVVVEYLKSVI